MIWSVRDDNRKCLQHMLPVAKETPVPGHVDGKWPAIDSAIQAHGGAFKASHLMRRIDLRLLIEIAFVGLGLPT